MSIKVMTLVWDRLPAAGSELLAMLALADWCADDGGSLYPSIATLAKKIRVSESQARRLLHGLIAEGYITVIGNENGGAPGTTRQYKVIVPKLKALPALSPDDGDTGSTDARGSADARGGMDARDGSHGCAETGSTHDTQTVILSVSEPLKKKKEESAREKPVFDDDAGKIIGISAAMIAKWREAFPAIDVDNEIAKAEVWLIANPKNRKSDYLRFLSGWMQRAQDKAPRVVAQQQLQNGGGTTPRSFLNKQEALEARNRAVAEQVIAELSHAGQ